MRSRKVILTLVAIIAIGFGLGFFIRASHYQTKPTRPSSSPTPSAVPSPVDLNPLEIEAIRKRSYPGGEIKIEQDLGNRTSSHDYIVSYPSDGLKLYSLMSVPFSAKPAGGYPVLILNHGYIPPAQYQTDGADYKSFIAAFAQAGYLVFKPDYRGHGRSEGTAEGGHFSPVYAYDILNLMASVKRYGDANYARLGMIGHSLGGHVTLRSIVVSKDIKASVIAAGVVGSAEDLFFNWPRPPFRNDQPTGVTRANIDALLKKYGDPHQNPDFWRKVSAINYVSAVAGPVQIHHGTADDQVPKLFSDHLDTTLKQANKPDEYYVYPGGDHQFTVHRALFLDRVINFFNQNLK